MRVGSLEGIVGNLSGQLEVLINMVGNIEHGIRASGNSSDGGCATQFNAPEFIASQFQNSTDVANNQRCEILNSDLDIIETGTVCRDSTSSKIHGKSAPPTHEKVVLDNILLPDERTSKINHQFAETFAEVGVAGYVCYPKGLIQYLWTLEQILIGVAYWRGVSLWIKAHLEFQIWTMCFLILRP